MLKIKRKSLLYKTKVEYGDFTVNHVLGCSHGCLFPCYAFNMAKRFGHVKTYKEWCSLKAHPEWSDQIVSFLWALDVTDIFRIQVIRNDKGMETVGISHCFVNAKGTEAYGQTFMNESLSLRRLILIAVSFFEAFSKEKIIVIDD